MREAASDEDGRGPAGTDFSAPGRNLVAPSTGTQATGPSVWNEANAPSVWGVGALCRAVADALDARFNPVAVRGEITGFSRAASGHCYFSLKDASGQIRCAMFRRAASLLSFAPRDGSLVEVRGKLGVYEQRGDLQLVVESMQVAGQGALFEQFLRLKAQLEQEGLFEPARKRPLPISPRGIGVVTSLGAAALHDVTSALRRRVPHIPVTIVPALVQGAQAPAQLCEALSKLYLLVQQFLGPDADMASKTPPIDVILLVRGGGSLEDLWAFNDERLARLIAQSPVPIICGIGHETDFTIADFVADLRAPTPTAAAELCATERSVWLGAVHLMAQRLHSAVHRESDTHNQRLDIAAQRLGRPSDSLGQQRLHLQHLGFNLQRQLLLKKELFVQHFFGLERDFASKIAEHLRRAHDRTQRAERSLELLSPQRVLDRGYALLQGAEGQVLGSTKAVKPGQKIKATLADGSLAVTAD